MNARELDSSLLHWPALVFLLLISMDPISVDAQGVNSNRSPSAPQTTNVLVYLATTASNALPATQFIASPPRTNVPASTDAGPQKQLDGITRRLDDLVFKLNSQKPSRWAEAAYAAQVMALGAALFYFLYRVVAGWYNTAMTVQLNVTRMSCDNKHLDILVVKLNLNHGDQGSLYILTAEARVTVVDRSSNKCVSTAVIPFVGLHRVGLLIKKSRWPYYPLTCSIDWSSGNGQPFRLSPKECTQFECHTKVPKSAVCYVEITLFGRKPLSTAVGQWRASTVSPPNLAATSSKE